MNFVCFGTCPAMIAAATSEFLSKLAMNGVASSCGVDSDVV